MENISPEALGIAVSRPSYVPGRLVVKLRPELFPLVPIGDADDAVAAADSSTLGIFAKLRVQNTFRRHHVRFRESLFLPPRLRPLTMQPTTRVQTDWQGHVDAVRKRFASRTATAPEGAEVPNLTHIYVVEVAQDDTEAAAVALAKDPHVEYAHPDFIVSVDATTLPNVSFVPDDPDITLDHTNWSEWLWPYPVLWGLQKIQAIEAWNQFAAPAMDPGRGVVVAVVDTGVDYTHADIVGNVWLNTGEDLNHNGAVDGAPPCVTGDFNCVDDDHDGYVDDLRGWNFVSNGSDPRDDHFHGTHIAGTIAARVDNGLGIAGVAPNATILPVKALDSFGKGSCTNLGRALVYMADRGARVNNDSWGGARCPEIRTAAQYAYSLGVVLVAAAGNHSRNAMAEEPGNRPEVITVAASDPSDQATHFTNRGSKIDVAAPGGGPPGDDSVDNIVSLQASGTNGCIPVSPGYCRAAGTSMAVSHVAGVAALIRSRHPSWNVEQVRQALRMSADDVGNTGWDTDSGFGRVNALRAVTLPEPPTATITNIAHEQAVNGVTTVAGQVGPRGMSLARSTLSYRLSGQTEWRVIQQVASPTPGTIDAQWDVHSLPIGQYVLQLEVENSAGQLARDERRVYRSVYQDVSTSNLPPGAYELSIPNRAVRLADIDGDGDLDLVPCLNVGSPPSAQQLWINDGTGHFTDQSATRFPAAHQFACADALFVDVDNDGDLDLFMVLSVTRSSSAQLVRLWINDGSGTFTDQTSTRLPSIVGNTNGINGSAAAADIDHDGDQDIVTTVPGMVLINDGTGHFSDETATRMPWLTCSPTCSANFADIDHDGSPDFITGNAVGLNNGAGSFTQRPATFAIDGFPDVVVGDVNGDGAPDVLAGEVLYLNDGAGNFPQTGQTLVANACFLNGALIDADGDGVLDVLLTSTRTGGCILQDILLINNGGASFTDRSDELGFVPFYTRRLGFADVTGDGYPDLLLAGLNGDPPVTMKQSRWDQFPPACVGDCNGSGAVTIDELIRSVSIALGGQPVTNCRRGDANGDGQLLVNEIQQSVTNALNGC